MRESSWWLNIINMNNVNTCAREAAQWEKHLTSIWFQSPCEKPDMVVCTYNPSMPGRNGSEKHKGKLAWSTRAATSTRETMPQTRRKVRTDSWKLCSDTHTMTTSVFAHTCAHILNKYFFKCKHLQDSNVIFHLDQTVEWCFNALQHISFLVLIRFGATEISTMRQDSPFSERLENVVKASKMAQWLNPCNPQERIYSQNCSLTWWL